MATNVSARTAYFCVSVSFFKPLQYGETDVHECRSCMDHVSAGALETITCTLQQSSQCQLDSMNFAFVMYSSMTSVCYKVADRGVTSSVHSNQLARNVGPVLS